MKKILFFILAVILVVSSGVQAQAAELPFVPDGEETTSEVPSQTLTLNAPSPAQASPPIMAQLSRQKFNIFIMN